MCVECNSCGHVFSLRSILLFFEACTGAGPVDTAKFKLKYKSLQSASTLTKAGTTRGHDICLTCRSIHFHSSEYENNSQL